MNVRYKECDCVVNIMRYGNNRTAILLTTEAGKPVAKATVNITCFPVEEDEVLIQDSGENEDILKCLKDAGAVKPTGKKLCTGDTILHICKVLVPVPSKVT
ncbi:MAG: hypothetical protein K1564_15920 [Candidatus Thiodiazotropha sp. (ex. Lucinisca nassula)]|nr:hypothetical protein [Candidatus Thiodiazotropha sp. (ex. Lucinisca nassula)]